MRELIRWRDIALAAHLPIGLVMRLPPQVLDELVDAINARDRAVTMEPERTR